VLTAVTYLHCGSEDSLKNSMDVTVYRYRSCTINHVFRSTEFPEANVTDIRGEMSTTTVLTGVLTSIAEKTAGVIMPTLLKTAERLVLWLSVTSKGMEFTLSSMLSDLPTATNQ